MVEIKKSTRKPSRAGKRLNEAEQTEAIALWQAGSTTLDELAEKFHRSRGTFIRLFNAKGVAKGEKSAEHTRKVAEAVETAALGDVEVIAQRIKETKDEHYKISSGLTKLVWGLIVQARQDKRAYSTIGPDLKALKYAADIFKTTRDEKYALLGLNERESPDDEEIADLIVQEITQEEIIAQRKAQQSDEDELRLLSLDDSEIGEVSESGDLQ
jgi:hypothetical protein